MANEKLYLNEVIDAPNMPIKDVVYNEVMEPVNLENGQFDGGNISKDTVEPAVTPGSGLPDMTGHSGQYLTNNGVGAFWNPLDPSVLSLSYPDNLGFKGITIPFTAGESLTAGALFYIKSDGMAYKTNAAGILYMPGVGIATTLTLTGETGVGLTYGIYRNDSLFNWTTGNILYVQSDAAGEKGAFTNTAPSAGDSVTQPVAIALSADIIFLNPQLTLVTHTP